MLVRRSRLLVWKKPKNELWNNTCVHVLHWPGQCCVQMWINTCERRWTRAISPRLWKLVPWCQRVPAVAKLDTRERDVDSAMRSAAIVAGHLRAMCRQREESAGNSSPSNSNGKSSGKSNASRGSTNKCCCCGQIGHRRHECPRRNESCSLCGKRGHLSQVCRSSGGNANALAVEVEPVEPEEQREIQHVWALSVYDTSGFPLDAFVCLRKHRFPVWRIW